MYHMTRASVRDLRYRFPEIERQLLRGEKIEITRRRHVIATLLPASAPDSRRPPDFLARLRKIYGKRTLPVTGADLLARERERF